MTGTHQVYKFLSRSARTNLPWSCISSPRLVTCLTVSPLVLLHTLLSAGNFPKKGVAMRNMLFLVFFALALAGCAPAVVVRPLNDRAEKAPVDERIQGEADNPEAFSMVLHFCRPGAVCSEQAVRNLPVFP